MPYKSLQQVPGVNVEKSPIDNGAGWSYSMATRFRDGLPEKIGGWSALNATAPLVGIGRGMHAWATLDGTPLIAIGTDQRLQLFSGGTIQDITPIRATSDEPPDFSTVINTPTITVMDVDHGALAGDWVDIVIPVAVAGLVLQGYYQVQLVVDLDNYTITAASDAASTVSNGGAVPVFDTTNLSTDVTVTLANHGLVPGNTFNVEVETTVGGLMIAVGIYTVVNAPTADTFVIQPGGTASSDDTQSENGGDARIAYLVPAGLTSATYPGGYGVGPYGSGPYGTSSNMLLPLRQWFLDNFGQDLVGNYNGSPIFLWEPPTAPNNVAVAISTANFPDARQPPTRVNVSFVAAPQHMIIALGCDTPGTGLFNPNLVRWCDQDDFTDWQASSLNQAGSYPIPGGSRLVGGLSAPNFTVIWTDVDMWLMSYLGGTGLSGLVWGFSKIAGGAGLLAARACGLYENRVFFCSSNAFYVFDGNSITPIPCPVWDKFWKNVNRTQIDKVNIEVNSYFQEVSIVSQSLDGTEVDQRITYNIRENSWTYDDAPTLTARTCWIDENVYGAPIGTDASGLLQQHDSEGVYDANGAALPAAIRTGWFALGEGSLVSMMERLEADLIVSGGTGAILITVYAQDYATGPVRIYGPYTWVVGTGPPWAIVRARGRFFSIMISSAGAGIFWRLGNLRYLVQQAGRRP